MDLSTHSDEIRALLKYQFEQLAWMNWNLRMSLSCAEYEMLSKIWIRQ
jgi:hypothetical protein